MTELFKQTGNTQALQVAEEINQPQPVPMPGMQRHIRLHPIMQEMVTNTNANSYERVYAVFKGEKGTDNVIAYIWLLVSHDRYGTRVMTIKQWYMSDKILNTITCGIVFDKLISYIMDIAERCKVQRMVGGVMQPGIVNFWKKINGFKAKEVVMEFEGSAQDFYELNPKLNKREKNHAKHPKTN